MTELKQASKKELKTKVSPIQKSDINEVAEFLHAHMNNKFSAQVWAKALDSSWVDDNPNHGFMMKNEKQEVVGAICALYSEQMINGTIEKMCNPHSWCVLPEYRTKSIQLVLSTIRQAGFHFTMFTPNTSGLEIFTYLRFKPLNNDVTTLVNVPKFLANKLTFINEPALALTKLTGQDLTIYKDHLNFPWLDRLVFAKGDRIGFILFKPQQFKKLTSINILFVSDSELFSEYWSDIRSYLLLKHGIFTTRIESRHLKHKYFWAFKPEHGQQKFYLSPTLPADDVQNIYSELVAMDL